MTPRKLLALAIVAFAFLTCNLDPDAEHRINLYLNDSLSVDKGRYDSLRISLYDADGGLLQPNVFHGPFYADSNGGALPGLLVGKSKPGEYSIRIEAFREGDSALFEIRVVAGKADSLVVKRPLPNGPKPPDNPDVTVPTELAIDDSSLTLGYFGTSGTSARIYPILKPAGSVGIVQYRTDNPLIADVDETGLITAKGIGDTYVRANVAGAANLRDSVAIHVTSPPAIESINFVRAFATVYVGAPARKLATTHKPPELTPILEYRSSDTGVIVVTQTGLVKAIRAGDAMLTVKAIGLSSLEDTLHLQAVVDAPDLDVGPTQKVAVGQRVSIPIRATQRFGSVRLSWDFDGDGIADSAVDAETAVATHIYGKAGDYEVAITAEDEEGNIVRKSVRVLVGKAGPLVIFTSPKADTLVNTPDMTIAYTVDGAEKRSDIKLQEGANPVTARGSNETGTDSASLTITLDTKKPEVSILEPANGSITRQPIVNVVWSADKVLQQTRNKEDLGGKQGKVSIIRRYLDSAGNLGMDSIVITYDSIPPGAPVFLAADSNTNLKKPEWKWKSGGGGGNGVFSCQLDDSTEKITSQTRFSPGQDLNDGKHILQIREQDEAGNWSPKSFQAITIRTGKPGAPSFIDAATTKSPTNNPKPVWKWKSGGSAGGGIGVFQYTVNTPTPIQREDTATGFTPANALPDGAYTLELKERDAFGNWSDPVSRGITVATRAPKVEITKPARGFRSNAKNGSITVEWKVNDAAQDSLTGFVMAKEGDWNLIRREFRDAANNLGFDTLSVFWDTTAPKVAIAYPKNGTTVNKSTIPVSWSIDGIKQTAQLTEDLGAIEGNKTVSRSFSDPAGNIGTVTNQVSLLFDAPAFTRIRKILVLDKSQGGAGGHLESRRDLNLALSALSTEKGFSVTTLRQADSLSVIANAFTLAKLKENQVVLFSHNDGVSSQLDSLSKMNVEKYVDEGGTLIAVHAASAFITGWPWLTNSLVQSFYSPQGTNQPRANLVHDAPALAAGTASSGIFRNLTAPTAFLDEFYSFRATPRGSPGVTILTTLDESSSDKPINGAMGADHPVVWATQVGKGYVVNFSLGHSWSTNNAYAASDSYLKSLLYGIMRFGAGDFAGCTDPANPAFNPDAIVDAPSQCSTP